VRLARLHRLAGLGGQAQDVVRVGQQGLAGGGEHHALALAHEQLHTQRRLQLADARGYVRLHAVQLRRRTCDATFAYNGAEDFQRGQIHDVSRMLMGTFNIIHFSGCMMLLSMNYRIAS
jgi:hypothetical protein